MILSDIGMLASESNRTRLYLQQMVRDQLLPAMVILMEDPIQKTPENVAIERSQKEQEVFHNLREGFDFTLSVSDYLEENHIPYQVLPWLDPNRPEVIRAVESCQPSILIYSGPGGAILRSNILSTGKQFLHIHPGYLPGFGGSTTIYYSLLKENLCGVSALFLTKQIDAGPVIRREFYQPPSDRTSIDLWYDPLIRSELLAKVLNDYAETGKMEAHPQSGESDGETYFIVHPVLKHIAILSD
jgi:methionyl-tRNA formyltransferase